MKNKKSKSDYIGTRNEELRARLIERMGRYPGRLDLLWEEIATLPAGRFYISEERAARLLSHRRRTGSWPRGIKPHRCLMLEEIWRRVELARRRNPEKSLSDIVFEVVNSPAPSLYITAGSMRAIMSTYRNSLKNYG